MFASIRSALSGIQMHQWIGAGLAVTAIGVIATLFFIEYLYGYSKPEEELVYFQSWDADRSYDDAAEVQAGERQLRTDAEALADSLATEALDAGNAPVIPESVIVNE